jgi:hypothetical protein
MHGIWKEVHPRPLRSSFELRSHVDAAKVLSESVTEPGRDPWVILRFGHPHIESDSSNYKRLEASKIGMQDTSKTQDSKDKTCLHSSPRGALARNEGPARPAHETSKRILVYRLG